MTKETEEFLLLNKLGNTTGIRKLKEILKLDAGFTPKQINVMDIDQIVRQVKIFQQQEEIGGS